MWFLHPSKEEIESWVESREIEFTEKENKSPRLSTEYWLERYVFNNLHEVFFINFPIDLHAWLSRLVQNLYLSM